MHINHKYSVNKSCIQVILSLFSLFEAICSCIVFFMLISLVSNASSCDPQSKHLKPLLCHSIQSLLYILTWCNPCVVFNNCCAYKASPCCCIVWIHPSNKCCLNHYQKLTPIHISSVTTRMFNTFAKKYTI